MTSTIATPTAHHLVDNDTATTPSRVWPVGLLAGVAASVATTLAHLP